MSAAELRPPCGAPRKDGTPCPSVIPWRLPDRECIAHHPDAKAAKVAAVHHGGRASRDKHRRAVWGAPPAPLPPPEFSSTATIVRWAQATAQQVLCGGLDPRAAGEARQLAALTIAARVADAQERIADVLAQVEHGGMAALLFAQIQQNSNEPKQRVSWRRQPAVLPVESAPPEEAG